MTIGGEFSSFSQYYQLECKNNSKSERLKDSLEESDGYLCDDDTANDSLEESDGYLSDDDTGNDSLDGFIVPDDYSSESDDQMSETEDLPPRRVLPRAAKNSGSRKRCREDEYITSPENKRKKTQPISDSKWIQFKKSTEYCNLTEQYEKNGSYQIVGRDSEVQRIIRLVTQENGGTRPILIGPPNVGKCGIVKHLSERLAVLKTADSFSGRSVVMLDCQAVVSNWIASVDELQVAMVVRQKVTNLLKKHANPIVFFRNIDAFLKYDESTDFLRSFFRQPINMIASVSGDEKSELVGKCQSILAPYNFKTMKINECGMEHLPKIIRQNFKKHPFPYENMQLSDEALLTAIKLADKHIKDRPFPIKAINLIRESASLIYYSQERSSGKELIEPEDVAEVVHQETGITVKELMANSVGHIDQLEAELKEQIVGQEQAIHVVCSHMKKNRIGLGRGDKPAGVFLFVGPTGVGKTLLAEKLAEGLFHDKEGFERINMEGYSEPTSLSKLIGTAPGYVGYGQAGSLDGKISRKPHLVVLFDEIEKAHEEVILYLLGIFDTGFMENGKGEKIDCRNVTFVMTSNVAAEELLKISKRKELDEDKAMSSVEAELKKHFKPEFLNRMNKIVPFEGLQEKDYPQVVAVHLEDIRKRYFQSHQIKLSWTEPVIDYFVAKVDRPEYGMRDLGKGVDDHVGDAVTILIDVNGGLISGKVHVDVQDKQLVAERIS